MQPLESWAPPWSKPGWGQSLAWRFPRKIGKEVAGSGWGESGGVPREHGGDNFLLLTESGLAICSGGTMDLCLACRIMAGSKSQTLILFLE